MKVITSNFQGLLVLEPKLHYDERGYFMESYNHKVLQAAGVTTTFVQDNHSYSKKGVLRGLHFQRDDFAQAKLVRVVQGEILDVVVDLREGDTFCQAFALKLSNENKKQLFVPKGFAHGFVVLSDEAQVHYKCDNYFSPDHEVGIRYDDPDLSIDWMLPQKDLVLSEKDMRLPYLSEMV